MPEGDTIFRAAHNLRLTMSGETIVAARARDDSFPVDRLQGRLVQDVEARGKHLLMHLQNDHVLHSHMGMTGSWHLYNPGEPWRKPTKRAALVLELAKRTVVCFSPKTLELLTAIQCRRHRYLSRLGPDLLSDQFDPAEALRRLKIHARTEIGVAIMDQTVVSGIGNVYKSEILFLSGFEPRRACGNIPDEQLLEMLALAVQCMRRNLDGNPRRTRFKQDAHRLWVYGRGGKPCFRCGSLIEMTRQGDLGRSTYWCPKCQQPGQ